MRPSKEADKRGEETKSLILKAALELFGHYGYELTSTRMIAQKSKANIAAIGYHFGGKEGLYRSVLMFGIDGSYGYFDEVFSYSTQISNKKNVSKAEAKKVLEILTDSLVKMLVEVEEMQNWARIISRELVNPSESFDVLYERKIAPLYDIYCKMISVIIGAREGNLEVKIMAHSLFGQVLSFTSSKQSFLKMIEIDKLNNGNIKLIKKILIRNCLNILKI